ncbi:hypothetical protein VPNG_01433 [Cytospora leucostoma]|uniref:Helicase ATP-binding domain-containing protein n=1 Tax=Cytospora leucostoma TaxID=1230097 RepID=A0A423XKM7_9PEZI|nr:hypothetical protein VPNG_01433 [Cytospora leucostoma]
MPRVRGSATDRIVFIEGFQLLHAVHAIESFLHKLKERGCNFHIAWFHDHDNLCLSRALGEELESHAEDRQFVSFEFQDLGNTDFEEYLDYNAIRFFLCLDGPTFDACSKDSAAGYLSVAHHLAARGYSLAFINDVEFASSGVRASVVSPMVSRKLAPVDRIGRSYHNPFTPLHDGIELATKGWSPWKDGSPLSAREWSSLYALCVMAIGCEHEGRLQEFYAWASAFLTHLVLLRRLPLSQRSFDMVQVPDRHSATTFLSDFSGACLGIITSLPPGLKWDLFDLLDGRLLRYVLGRNPRLPQSLTDEVRAFASKIVQLTSNFSCGQSSPFDITNAGTCLSMSDDNKSGSTIRSVIPVYGVLSFSNPILDDYLKEIRLAPTTVPEQEMFPTTFRELSHWHNARVSVDMKRIPQPKTERQLRGYYKLMAATIAYSASLTNASGKMIDPEIIVVTDELGNQPVTKNGFAKGSYKPKQQLKPVRPVRQAGAKKGPKKGGKELAQEAAQVLQEKKALAKTNDALIAWEQQRRSLEKEPGLTRRYLKAIKYLNSLSERVKSAVGNDVSLYACNVLASMLARPGPHPARKEDIFAMIWSAIKDLSKPDLVADSAVKLLKSLDKTLRLPAEFGYDVAAPAGRLQAFAGVFGSTGKTFDWSTASVEFQLQHCGPFLERSFDSAPDSRVPFNPDAWQRKVLDAIDESKSLFVVAPTSAGKTFISFYAMKRVLQESNDGVLVYVAPTKALVNQIAAEIQARYSKRYDRDARSVWAIHTRDYRVNNPAGCQILVTVPHILQIMLLAPSNADNPRSWSRRVKRIIFDEVHCIGQADDGVIWEQLLLLAPCPIIALSATVGNPLEFKAWLEESERVKGNELAMIVHPTRYSDLRKFLWQGPRDFVFDGLQPIERLPIPGLDDGSEVASRFYHIHPVATLINRNRGTIQDLSLEPRDCLMLWKSMAKTQTSDFTLDPGLKPDKALPDTVKKADVATYETVLKDALNSWMNDRNSPFEAVRRDLQPRCRVSPMSSTALKDQILPLLTDLRSQGALPAILFNYDRVNCEDFAFRLWKDLTHAEKSFQASNPVWKKKMADFEQWKKTTEKTEALNKSEDPSTWATFDPDAPLPQYSFADETKFSKSELNETIYSLRFKEINPQVIEALRRGIGIHHAGMNRKYRQTVEMLFRKGFLTVVFATGTLALGLNMPCKTVVFFGDSVFLTALNYHQAAGRAGRRGFDLLGNVIFVGMSKERVFEIMSSKLPDLRGHFPLSTTLVLRTLSLLHHTNKSDYSVRAIQSLLSQTRLYLGGPADQMAIKHHLRFSIEYLRRQHILDRDGAPLNFAGLVGHLYFTEGAVFAFHSLLKEGYFHSLCADFRRRPDAVLLKIVLVLSHIFCRISTRGFREGWREAVHNSPSVVFLPPLPDDALQVLRQHNRDTLEIFKNYVGTFVEQHLDERPDRCLPFTKFEVGAPEEDMSNTDLADVLADGHHLVPTKLRSPFDALSGFTDHSFSSIHELCSTVRSGVFLEESAIPFIPIYPDDTEGVAWNAYIYDFFKHGDMEALVRYNHIKRGDVWFHLKDFSLILATIVTSLSNFLDSDGGGDADLAMLDVQDANEAQQEKLDAMDSDDVLTAKLQDASISESTGLDATRVGPAAHKKSKKAKIIESWEDDDSLDDDAENEPQAASFTTESRPTSQQPGAPGAPASSAVPPAWEGDGEKDLLHVLHIFKMVQQVFDDKFRNIWT